MDGLLILRNVKVENANAVAGFVWGFPAISNFLGFTHALSRKVMSNYGVKFDGCAVICHDSQVQAYKSSSWGDYNLALTRNPLTKEGDTRSFNEEGRMHMTISLVIPCSGKFNEDDDLEDVKAYIKQIALSSRLAGGTITAIKKVELEKNLPEDSEGFKIFERSQLRKLLPGYALVQRSDLLAEHTQQCIQDDPNANPLDALLDFSAIKYEAEYPEADDDEHTKVKWNYVPKPSGGWLVPISIGYRAISDLYPSAEVENTRDNTTPFRFVESTYTVGQWISPHRAGRLKQLIWTYHANPESGWYLCKNIYKK